MSRCILLFFLLFLTALTGVIPLMGADRSLPPRIVEISGSREKIRELEIVVEQPVPVVSFAAKELQNFLKKATGITFPVVKKAKGTKTALFLGDSLSLKKAGIDVNKLPDEGYYIIRKGKNIFLAGKDHPQNTPMSNRWQQLYKRGTLSAVYDFLERFAGARFFFAGAGTVIPARGALYLPQKINIMERPDMSHRNYSPLVKRPGRISWPGYHEKGAPHGETLNRIRLRFSESLLQFSHGLNQLHLAKRFAETHPEYFALMSDGRRCIHPDIQHSGHICYNSGVREEIYQDVKAYFTGKKAASRQLPRWDFHLVGKGFFNVMAQDWLYWCGCPECRKIGTPGRGGIYHDPKQRQAVSDFVWQFAADIAGRLKKEGIKGGVTHMAYTPYDKIPRCSLPDNLRVMVAVNGNGAVPQETAHLKAWAAKSGRKNTVWTYAIGKHMSKKIAGVPPMLHKGLGNFIDANKDYIDGGYFENESDYLIYQYLNCYVLAKKMWNTSLDTEKLLDDHYRAMFGKGAPMMKEFYDTLEMCWQKKILGNTIDTGLGPVTRVPTDHQIWTEIYSQERIKHFNKLFDRALKAVGRDAGAAQRLRYIRQHLLGPLAAAAGKYQASLAALDSWIAPCPGSVWLRPCAGEKNEVNTKVTLSADKDALVFTFDCEEPRMADLIARKKSRDARKLYTDSDVEILLNPSGDRKNYFHFVVNANGAVSDYRCQVGGKPDISWNSSAAAKAVRKKDKWSVTVRIPLKDLGRIAPEGFPVNFCRHRALKGKKVKEIYYHWSAASGRRGGFHAIENWGTLELKKKSARYLLKADFAEGKLPSCWRSGGEKGGQVFGGDKKIFISGGRSLYFKNVKNKRMSSGFKLPGMKPSTRYRFSYFLKTEKLSGRGGAGAYIYFNKSKGQPFPRIQTLGTTPWHRQTFEITTPADTGSKKSVPVLGLWIWNAEGEAWFDNIEILELGPAKKK